MKIGAANYLSLFRPMYRRSCQRQKKGQKTTKLKKISPVVNTDANFSFRSNSNSQVKKSRLRRAMRNANTKVYQINHSEKLTISV